MNWRLIVGLLVSLFLVAWKIFTEGLLIVGMLVGALGYHQFGLQPRLIGWTLAFFALALVWWAGLWTQGFELLAAINLAIMVLLSFYYQMKDEEATPPFSDTEALQVRDVFYRSGGRFREQLGIWSMMTQTAYSIWGSWEILFLSLSIGNKAELPFYCLAAVASVLISIRYSGGTKGKVWEKIGKALDVKVGILPRLTFS